MSNKDKPREKKEKIISEELIAKEMHRINNQKGRILLNQPFYGVLIAMMDTYHEPSLPTFATDGRVMFFNAEYSSGLTDAEIRGVIYHELSHCIYMHCSRKRRQNRDPKKFNIACDFAINLEIRQLGETLPSHALLDEKYRDMNAEQIYDQLPADAAEKMTTLDSHIESDSDDWDDFEDKLIIAYEAAKADGKGDLPAGIKRYIEKLKKSKVNWNRIFQRYVGEALSNDDYSFMRPNRRFLSQDIILPSNRSTKIGDVILAIDTSGSIDMEQLAEFIAEVKKISHLVDSMTVITCDAVVHEVVKVHQMQDFMKKLKFKGGGGTDFVPIFEEINKRKLAPQLLIVFTDSFGTLPARKMIRYPVLWCINHPEGKIPKELGPSVYIPRKDDY